MKNRKPIKVECSKHGTDGCDCAVSLSKEKRARKKQRSRRRSEQQRARKRSERDAVRYPEALKYSPAKSVTARARTLPPSLVKTLQAVQKATAPVEKISRRFAFLDSIGEPLERFEKQLAPLKAIQKMFAPHFAQMQAISERLAPLRAHMATMEVITKSLAPLTAIGQIVPKLRTRDAP